MNNLIKGLEKTPLHSLHLQYGGNMVEFAGYEMPLHYTTGIIKEHLHTRNKASLFDVSHMGQIRLDGFYAASALETLTPTDVIDLPAHQQRYALFTNSLGGILDDFIIANTGDSLILTVNAACKHQDLMHLQSMIGNRCHIEPLFKQRALLALQGPASADVLARLAPTVATMSFMQSVRINILGFSCYVSRSGYTGEDGFEISIASEDSESFARRLLDEPEVQLAGLGARDSLRLEAGLCLYGHDMNNDITPIEASLAWAISKPRRHDGIRPGGFPGADRIYAQQKQGVSRCRIGIRVQSRIPVREGTKLFLEDGSPVGIITSGSFSPTLGIPIAMAYVDTHLTKAEDKIYAQVRGKKVYVSITHMPFISPNYSRKSTNVR